MNLVKSDSIQRYSRKKIDIAAELINDLDALEKLTRIAAGVGSVELWDKTEDSIFEWADGDLFELY